MKQGDSLSSLLFNAALEGAFRKWKRRIGEAGWRIRMNFERLTNTRYADDILVYAKSLEELMMMMEMLGEELAAIGLSMHETKTKILTTSTNPQFQWVEIRGMMIEILQRDHCHKYLGRLLNMDPTKRINFELQNRKRMCWAKFHQHRRWLVNMDVPVGLRLRLFDAICSPTILYGSAVLPLGLKQRQSLDILQRKMLRLMVGWRRLPGEE